MGQPLARAGQRQAILWTQVFGLAALQAAISLSWLVYNLYLPQLLAQFGFPVAIATTLLIIESLLAILMEPLMGGLSDRAQQWFGSRFPMIVIGVLAAVLLFLGIPAIALFGPAHAILRWLLLIVLVVWSLAMAVFRSPALSLIGNYAFAVKLPQAASILTLGAAFVGLTNAFARQTILSWGPLAAFGFGSGVLILAVVGLYYAGPEVRVNFSDRDTLFKRPVASRAQLSLVFAVGLGIGLGTTLLRALLASPPLAATFAMAHFVTILPMGWLAVRWGNSLALRVGLGAIGLLAVLVPLASDPWAMGLAILLGLPFSLVINGTFPFALSLVPTTQSGLSLGLFFSGGAVAGALWGAANQFWGTVPPIGTALICGIAFWVAAACVSLAPRSRFS
jgi:hypothetical protein